MARLGLPEPEFREDGFSFVITFRSIAPREGITPIVPADRSTSLSNRGSRDGPAGGLVREPRVGWLPRATM
jgi:hypothetical protein